MSIATNQSSVEYITPDPDCPDCDGRGEFDEGYGTYTLCQCVEVQVQDGDSEIILDQTAYYSQ